MARPIPTALTVAGSDSGGGAGVQADLKTFAALGVYGSCAITSITAQNTLGVAARRDVEPRLVAAQIDAVLGDIGADAVKLGMLGNRQTVEAVADRMEARAVERLVIDPVMVSKSGHRLLEEDAVRSLVEMLFPLALIVTPNVDEARVLGGVEITGIGQMREAARRIASMGPRFVLVTGGDALWSDAALDLLYDGERFEELSSPRVHTKNTHGAGCTLSAAICAYLAHGCEPRDAVFKAKAYVTEAIRTAIPLGSGHGPLNHFWTMRRKDISRGGQDG